MPVVTAAANEYKSKVGLKNLYIAAVTQDDTSAYAAGTPETLAPAVTATQKATTNQKVQYADDAPFDAMSAEGETSIELEITGIPVAMLAYLTGRVWNSTNGRMFDNSGATPPYFALGFQSVKSTGTIRYYWYLKGRFSMPDDEAATLADSPDPKTIKLTFTAIKTIYQFTLSGSVTDGAKRVIGDADSTNFVATGWFTSVQVPVMGATPALTMTPTPANNATGIATSVNPTIVFNNPMRSGADGILLYKNTDGSVPAATYTLSADRKTVTIVPGSALTAAAVYNISLIRCTDVYGQAYASTVLKFTCA